MQLRIKYHSLYWTVPTSCFQTPQSAFYIIFASIGNFLTLLKHMNNFRRQLSQLNSGITEIKQDKDKFAVLLMLMNFVLMKILVRCVCVQWNCLWKSRSALHDRLAVFFAAAQPLFFACLQLTAISSAAISRIFFRQWKNTSLCVSDS